MKNTTYLRLTLALIATSIFLYVFDKFTENQTIKLSKQIVTTQIECLAKNIYYEAAGENFEGKVAVAQVTINRSNDKNFPSDICEVVYQKTGSTCQFSWFCQRPNVVPKNDSYQWQESIIVAQKVLTGQLKHDKLEDSLYYHADYVDPKWTHLKKITKIGRHIFYKDERNRS